MVCKKETIEREKIAFRYVAQQGSSEGSGVFLGRVSLAKNIDAGVEQIAVTKVKFAVPLFLQSVEK